VNWQAVLKTIAPKGSASILAGIANAMPGIVAEFALNTELRQAHFLAQLAHESAGFRTTVEYASGAAYEGRADLGNTQPGDGVRFKGRGLIQLTGRANYAAASKALGVDFVKNPALAAQFPHAIRVAGWYWSTRKLNALADADNVRAVTKKINGGHNGLEDRERYLARAKKVLVSTEAATEPTAPSMTTSKTGGAAILTGAGGAAIVAKEGVEAATAIKDATKDAWGLAVSVGPWVLLGVVIIGFAVYIWLERRKKLVEHGL
jgi:putative chitinase